MKRNNILMGAYIVFVFICVAVKFFSDYAMWGAIVSAVAISSALFSYADFFLIYMESVQEIYSVGKDFIIITRKGLDAEESTFSTISKEIEEIPKHVFDFSEMQASIATVMNKHHGLMQCIDDFEIKNRK